MAGTKGAYKSPDTIYSRQQVEDLIAQGRTIIIVDGFVLKADSWRPYHPGGDKAILHMVGRDATDEVNALHSPEARQRMQSYRIGRIQGRWINFVPPIQGGKFRPLSEQGSDLGAEAYDTTGELSDSSATSRDSSPVFDSAEDQPLRWRNNTTAEPLDKTSVPNPTPNSITSQPKEVDAIGSRTQQEIDFDLAKYPTLDPQTQDDIVQKYRALNQRIRDAGLYQCNYAAYAREGLRYLLLFSLCLYFLRLGWYSLSGIFLGCFWHQLVFTAHDAGHMGITHDYTTDTIIGIIISDFLGGLSIGWWKRNHNVHHIVTNSPEHDPDIEHMPFFAISHRFFDSLRSTYYERIMTYDFFAKTVIPIQHYLYYPILMFGRFNLYRLSWEYLILGLGPRKGPGAWFRWLEIAGNLFFWLWFGYGILYYSIPTWSGRFAFLMLSHMITMPLHVQITLSHFAMSTADLGVHESFPQKMLRTTMDVECPEWLDFFHGGLQFQAIHHLYPRIPRHNLRQTQKLVQEFCNDAGIPYALYGFVDGNKEVIGKLGDVSRQAAILAQCQKAIVENPSLMH